MTSHPAWIQAITHAQSLPVNKGKNIYQIAAVDSNNIPHVRSHVSRGILFPKGFPSLPLLLTSTDIRTAKVTQMLSNSSVELAWWMEGSVEQFRVNGKAYIIPPPSHPFHTMQVFPPGSALARLNELGESDDPTNVSTLEGGGFDWEKKRKEVFNDMSAGMKASWATPPPGDLLKSYDEANAWPGPLPRLEEADNKDDKKNLKVALGNFALVVIEPLEVDWVQLGVRPNRRTKFSRNEKLGNGDEWVEEIVVP